MGFDWRRYKAAPWDRDRTHLPVATARIGATEPMTRATMLEAISRIRTQLAPRFPSANPLTAGATETRIPLELRSPSDRTTPNGQHPPDATASTAEATGPVPSGATEPVPVGASENMASKPAPVGGGALCEKCVWHDSSTDHEENSTAQIYGPPTTKKTSWLNSRGMLAPTATEYR